MVLAQAVHTATRGNPLRWIALARLELGLAEGTLEAAARRAAALGWLRLNEGPVLHSVVLGAGLLDALR